MTTTAHSGPGSLRQAITDANALAGLDTIRFSVAAGGPQIIGLAAPLPNVTDTVVIDRAPGELRTDGWQHRSREPDRHRHQWNERAAE